MVRFMNDCASIPVRAFLVSDTFHTCAASQGTQHACSRPELTIGMASAHYCRQYCYQRDFITVSDDFDVFSESRFAYGKSNNSRYILDSI